MSFPLPTSSFDWTTNKIDKWIPMTYVSHSVSINCTLAKGYHIKDILFRIDYFLQCKRYDAERFLWTTVNYVSFCSILVDAIELPLLYSRLVKSQLFSLLQEALIILTSYILYLLSLCSHLASRTEEGNVVLQSSLVCQRFQGCDSFAAITVEEVVESHFTNTLGQVLQINAM